MLLRDGVSRALSQALQCDPDLFPFFVKRGQSVLKLFDPGLLVVSVGHPNAAPTNGQFYIFVRRLIQNLKRNETDSPATVRRVLPPAMISSPPMPQPVFTRDHAREVVGVEVGLLDALHDQFVTAGQADLDADAVADVVNTKDGKVFGETEVFPDGRREQLRTEETNLGNVTADANLAVAQDHDPTVLVSIKNGGGTRAPIGQVINEGDETILLPPQANPDAGKEDGQVSQLDDENALRFNNELTLVTLTPEQLLEVLEHGVAATEDGATPGQFTQVGGIRFSFDPTGQDREANQDTGEQTTAGERIQSAAIVTDNGLIPVMENGEIAGGAPESIRVVTLNSLAGGGDGYPFAVFADQDPGFADVVELVNELTDPGLVDFAAPDSEQDALAEYFAANHPVDGGTPFDAAETPIEEDTRIQNLAFRDDRVLEDDVTGSSVSVELAYTSEEAFYANTFGIYNVKTGEAEILETNTNLDTNENLSTGDILVSLELTAEKYAYLGYFIVGNGDRLND